MRNITTKTGIIRSLRLFYNKIQERFPSQISTQQQELTEVFDVIPTTFVMSSQYKTTDLYKFIKRFADLSVNEGLSLKESVPAKHCTKNMWLLKPATLNQGRGIQIFSKLKDIFDHIDTNQATNNYWVVQKYIEKPLLFHNRKFDIRVWALVTTASNGQDISVYMYKEGYLRTSSSTYDIYDQNKYVHLTNNCLQQKGNQYSKHEDGNTIGFHVFQEYLNEHFSDYDLNIERDFIPRMKDIIIDTIQSVQDDLNPQKRKNQFELLGYDFLIDEDFRIWLLEVNNNPYLGVPNQFIAKLLPQMIRDMFKITIPQSRFQNDNDIAENGFDLLYSTKDNFSLRRDYTLDLVYPIAQFKQQVGKLKKNEILQQRKEKFKAQQNVLTQNELNKLTKYTICIGGESLTQVTLKMGPSPGKKELQIFSPQSQEKQYQQQQQQLHQGISTQQSSRSQLMPLSKSSRLIDDYKELNKLAKINKQLISQINGSIRSPTTAGNNTQKQSSNQLETLQNQYLGDNDYLIGINQSKTPYSQIMKTRKNLTKDILQQAKDVCMKKDQSVTSEQFDHLLNRISSKIQQWELFDDKQIQKSLQALEIIFNSKAVVHFQSQANINKLIKLIEDDNTPIKYRVDIFQHIVIQSQITHTKQSIIENRTLIQFIDNTLLKQNQQRDGDRECDSQCFCKQSLQILSNLLGINQGGVQNNSSGSNQNSKQRKNTTQTRESSIQHGLLLILLNYYFHTNNQQEIQRIINILTLNELQLQMSQLKEKPDIKQQQYKGYYDKIYELLNQKYEKLIQIKNILKQKEQLEKTKNLEQEEKLKQQQEEEKEMKRKLAEEQFKQRLILKQKQQAEEKKKLLDDQIQVERQLEEQKMQKLQKILMKNKERKISQQKQEHNQQKLNPFYNTSQLDKVQTLQQYPLQFNNNSPLNITSSQNPKIHNSTTLTNTSPSSALKTDNDQQKILKDTKTKKKGFKLNLALTHSDINDLQNTTTTIMDNLVILNSTQIGLRNNGLSETIHKNTFDLSSPKQIEIGGSNQPSSRIESYRQTYNILKNMKQINNDQKASQYGSGNTQNNANVNTLSYYQSNQQQTSMTNNFSNSQSTKESISQISNQRPWFLNDNAAVDTSSIATTTTNRLKTTLNKHNLILPALDYEVIYNQNPRDSSGNNINIQNETVKHMKDKYKKLFSNNIDLTVHKSTQQQPKSISQLKDRKQSNQQFQTSHKLQISDNIESIDKNVTTPVLGQLQNKPLYCQNQQKQSKYILSNDKFNFFDKNDLKQMKIVNHRKLSPLPTTTSTTTNSIQNNQLVVIDTNNDYQSVAKQQQPVKQTQTKVRSMTEQRSQNSSIQNVNRNNRSPRVKGTNEKEVDQQSKEISEIIMLLLNQRKDKDIVL